jgi:hypothetical protein
LSVVRCPLSVAKALRNWSASAAREASNGQRTKDQRHRPPRAGAMPATDQGQRTTARQGRRDDSNGQRTMDNGHRPARAGRGQLPKDASARTCSSSSCHEDSRGLLVRCRTRRIGRKTGHRPMGRSVAELPRDPRPKKAKR